MLNVFAVADNAITSLGFTTAGQTEKIRDGLSGVRLHSNSMSPEPFYASLVDSQMLDLMAGSTGTADRLTRFEKLLIASASEALSHTNNIDPASPETLFVISTTKGNIELLENGAVAGNRADLWHSAQVVSSWFGNPNIPVVISNACISGVLAVITAHSLLASGAYRHAVVCGGDVVSAFVVSGFQSFKSLAAGPCRPFDERRDGLNLGEGAGTLVLSVAEPDRSQNPILVLGGASNNDANHISGPSRTGEGLYLAVSRAMQLSGTTPDEVSFISAHGTATPFNDEMESRAFSRAGLSNVPLSSFKGAIGHTLGGAGLIELAIALHGMRTDWLYPTTGFEIYGVPEKINILAEARQCIQHKIIKTASGFGGCNAAVVFSKPNIQC